eukprot:114709_1
MTAAELDFEQFILDDDTKDDEEKESNIDWDHIFLYQDVVFRPSEANDALKLVDNVITPSYTRSLFEFKYIIPRSHRPIRSEIIHSIFSKLIPFFIQKKTKYYNSYTFLNKKLNILLGYILTNNNINNISLIDYLILLWKDIIFTIPYHINIYSCWKLLQIYCAQKLIHHEFKRRFTDFKYESIEMIAVKNQYQNKGYGSHMIQQIHQQIYDDKNKCKNDKLPVILTYSSTPQSIHLYERNGYKQFITVFMGVEIRCHGFLYHKDNEYLNKILSAFPTNYQIDLSFYNHMLPNTAFKWILLIVVSPFIMIWIMVFAFITVFNNCYTAPTEIEHVFVYIS